VAAEGVSAIVDALFGSVNVRFRWCFGKIPAVAGDLVLFGALLLTVHHRCVTEYSKVFGPDCKGLSTHTPLGYGRIRLRLPGCGGPDSVWVLPGLAALFCFVLDTLVAIAMVVVLVM
jgi:hypothetical protein